MGRCIVVAKERRGGSAEGGNGWLELGAEGYSIVRAGAVAASAEVDEEERRLVLKAKLGKWPDLGLIGLLNQAVT